jgi:hypothetical protein
MTERAISFWIRDNLSPHIKKALEVHAVSNPKLIWVESDLAGIVQREVGFLIARYAPLKKPFDVICSLMKGDYGKREGEKEATYHGFSFWQLDVNTHLQFIKSAEWKNPWKACYKAIGTLEEKRIWLEKNVEDFKGFTIHRAAIAAYNCGQSNVRKVLELGQDIDARTFNDDYSKEVIRFSDIYKHLPPKT